MKDLMLSIVQVVYTISPAYSRIYPMPNYRYLEQNREEIQKKDAKLQAHSDTKNTH